MGARRVCIANQRAGVGKTATAVNLACGLAAAGEATLLIDLDVTCRSTGGLGHAPAARHPLAVSGPLTDSLIKGPRFAPDLLPGSGNLQDMALLRDSEQDDCQRLADSICTSVAGYDWVVLDCPSSSGRVTEIGLLASTEVLVPVRTEYFALEGTPQLVQVIKSANERSGGQLDFAGILLTMHEDSLELAQAVDKEVREFFGEIVFETVIPRDRAVSDADGGHLSVVKKSPRARAARAYVELCMEVLDRE